MSRVPHDPVALDVRNIAFLEMATRAECGDGIVHVTYVSEAMSTHVHYQLLCDESAERSAHMVHQLGSLTSICIPGRSAPRTRHANAKFYTSATPVTCLGCLGFNAG